MADVLGREAVPTVERRPVDPVRPSERHELMDIIRGVAVLGILLLNIRSFATPVSNYFNPTSWAPPGFEPYTGVHALAFDGLTLWASAKFISLFSMLFGAGIVLLAERVRARGQGPAGYHYTRTFWLLAIGLAHGLGLWIGDILTMYAITALVVYWLHARSPTFLLAMGFALLFIRTSLTLGMALSFPVWGAEAQGAIAEFWSPPAHLHAAEVAIYQSDWGTQNIHRMRTFQESLPFDIAVGLWYYAGLMCIGMALYKRGFFTGVRSARYYGAVAAVCLPIGLLGSWGYLQGQASHGWLDPAQGFFGWPNLLSLSAVFQSIGYAAIVALLWKNPRWGPRMGRLAATGRMALTNYLAQTMLCTTIFYGHGLGLFGQMPLTHLLIVAIMVWALQLLWSPLWLKHFRYGPFEWAWRCLTYGRWFALRRSTAEARERAEAQALAEAERLD